MSSLYSPALAREMNQHSPRARDRAARHLLQAALSQLRGVDADRADEIENNQDSFDALLAEYHALLAHPD